MASALERLAEPHSAVEFRVSAWRPVHASDEPMEYSVSYFAPDADLIASGIVTAEMLGPGKCGRPRRDAAGNKFSLHRRKTFSEIRFPHLPADHAVSLYGVTHELLEAAREDNEQWRLQYEAQYAQPKPREVEDEDSPDYARGVAWVIVQRGIEEAVPSAEEAEQFRLIREVLELAASRQLAVKILSGALSMRCSLKQTVNLLLQAPLRGAQKSRRLRLVVDNTRPIA